MIKLQWKVPQIDGYPKKNTDLCFLRLNSGTYQIGYYGTNGWRLSGFNGLPTIHDDSGCEYVDMVSEWAYVPRGLLDINYETCYCYITTPKGEGRCMGTKEIDPCNCGGDKRYCDFY